MLGAGLIARNAVKRGLKVKPWVKTSLAPGSQVVTDYLKQAGLAGALDKLGFNLVGYGCTTCIGNSGPLPEPIAAAITKGDLTVCSVLSGNRNFEGRVNPQTRANYLASPMLVRGLCAGGLAEGRSAEGSARHMTRRASRSISPTSGPATRRSPTRCAASSSRRASASAMPMSSPAIATGARSRPAGGLTYGWDSLRPMCRTRPISTACRDSPGAVEDVAGARTAGLAGRQHHHRPHLARRLDQEGRARPGEYLIAHGVPPAEFNSYGARRGNHEVMMRGTFANIRMKNEMVPGTEGGITSHLPDGETHVDLRRGHALPGGGRSAGGRRRQGIRHRLLARLGGQGHRCSWASRR